MPAFPHSPATSLLAFHLAHIPTGQLFLLTINISPTEHLTCISFFLTKCFSDFSVHHNHLGQLLEIQISSLPSEALVYQFHIGRRNLYFYSLCFLSYPCDHTLRNTSQGGKFLEDIFGSHTVSDMFSV